MAAGVVEEGVWVVGHGARRLDMEVSCQGEHWSAVVDHVLAQERALL